MARRRPAAPAHARGRRPRAAAGRARAGAGFALGLALLAAAVAGPAPTATAHPLAPALLELDVRPDGRVDVHWKTSRLRPRGAPLTPRLPEACAPDGAPVSSGDAQSVSARWTVDCGPGGLVGGTVGVDGLGPVRIDVLLRVGWPDGRVFREVLRAGESRVTVPPRQTALEVGRGYLVLGFEHILGGTDHLLFVLGLMLLVAGVRPLVATITAFTLGHSVTLALVTLGLARVPSAWAELAIAATILALAVELATPARARPALLRRRPWLMACGFGLVHGLGFAGALAEVGLPETDLPLALLAFNLGIEAGQLAFVAAIALVVGALRRPLAAAPAWLRRVPVYAIGSAAAFWCFERAAAIL